MSKKTSSDKLRLDLIPPELMWQIGILLTKNIEKHGERGWEEEPIKASDMIAALKRHITQWELGQRNDDDSKMSHLWSVTANSMIAAVLEQRGVLIDDLPFASDRANF